MYLNEHFEKSDDLRSQSEDNEDELKEKAIEKRIPLAQKFSSPAKSEELSDFNINFSDELIVLKTDNLIVEAKITHRYTEESKENTLGQTFNPSDISNLEENDEISLNETSKEFIFKLLKNFIEDLY